MSKTRKALHALVVLAFLTSLFALAIGEIVPNPDDFARKILDIRQSDASFDRSLKANPNQFGAQPAMDKASFLWEGFEDGVIPPTDWTVVEWNPEETWEIDTYNPFEGAYNASCFYDATYTDIQDEWLISPVMNFTAKSDLKVKFAWMMSYYWSVDPYDNYDLIFAVTTDGGSNWDLIWDEEDEGVFDSWVWYEKTIDLSAYETETTVQIALGYIGWDGAQASIDAIDVNDDAAPIGRCCYDYDVDPQNPQCADNTALECDALGGNWDGALNCTDDPCPALGPNDLCTGAIAMVDNDVIVGSTVGATVDCPGVLDWNAVWYSFENPYTCANVTMDYCAVPTVYNVECLGVVLYDECPEDCPNYILYTSNEWVNCGMPSTQPITHYDMLAAGDYWYPVFIGDGACDPIEADFSFRFLMVECPAAQDGDYCGLPIEVSIPGDLRGEYVDVNTTCGRLDYYGGQSTCLGYYDQGEDIIYEITVTTETCVDILVDPVQTYSGFALDDNCPPDLSCIVVATAGYSSTEYGVMGVDLAVGTYYLMIDTWPSPDCIPDFDL
ncbi:MAG: choice-of-anchor J domain-containing protein, partial [candidate division Zixibacteria bacterium]|nr:choice-of-anchor J domain-containing protein [candidate division Zixibacteria bacterium]